MASGYFVNVVPKNPNEDIVARRRKGDGGHEPKPRSRLRDHWYVRTLFNNLSPLLLLAMLGIGALGIVVFVVLNFLSDEETAEAGVVAVDGADTFVSREPRAKGDFLAGAPLSDGEAVHAARFGVPLYIGDGGAPVISVGSGEDAIVRELTELELSLPSAEPRLLSKLTGVWVAPGPVGLGVWWLGPVRPDGVPVIDAFSREEWATAQEMLLLSAMADLSEIGELFIYTDGLATESWAMDVVDATRRLRDRYAYGVHADWGVAHTLYECTDDAQVAAAGVASLPCPSRLYLKILGYAWNQYGGAVDALENVAAVYHPEYPSYRGLQGLQRDEYVDEQFYAYSSSLVRYFKSLHDLTLVGVDEQLPLPTLSTMVLEGIFAQSWSGAGSGVDDGKVEDEFVGGADDGR